MNRRFLVLCFVYYARAVQGGIPMTANVNSGWLCALAQGHFSKWLNPLPVPVYQDSTTDYPRAHSSSSGH